MKNKEQVKLFLDDYREPKFCVYYMYRTMGGDAEIYSHKWITVKNYNEFVEFVTDNAGNISHISFDHDLADIHYNMLQEEWETFAGTEKTGYDCAVWFKNLYQELNLPLPVILTHSMNPVGAERIKNLFNLK